MVHADQYHPLPEQGRFVPSQAGPVTAREILSRLLGRQRRQPCRQIPALALQPGQPSAPQPLSSVRITIRNVPSASANSIAVSPKLPTPQTFALSLPPSRTPSCITRWPNREFSEKPQSYPPLDQPLLKRPRPAPSTPGSLGYTHCTIPPTSSARLFYRLRSSFVRLNRPEG